MLFGLAAVVTAVAIVALGSGATFYHDEWTAIDRREAWTLDALIQPHNEHLSIGLAFVYKVIFGIVGMRSYLPYLVVLAALHVGVAAAVVRLALRRNGWGLALPLGVLMLLLGTGSENLYWAHQIGFVGSTACGLWALDAQQRGRWAIASVLLLVAVVTVGIGLPFVIAAITVGIVSGHRLRHVATVVVPAIVAFGTWYLAVGRTSVDIARGSSQLEALANMRDYLLTGVSHAIGSVSGLGAEVGLVVAVMTVVLLIATGASRQSWPPMAIAAIAGLLSSYAIYGVVRAPLGAEQATASRYVYVAGAFILVAIGAAPMRRIRAPHRPAAIAAGAILLGVALVVNTTALIEGHAYFDDQARRTRAVAGVVLRYADAPGIDQQRIISPQPSPERLRELMRRHGRVDEDAFLPDLVSPPTMAEMDAALWRIAGADFSVAVTDEPMTGAAPALSERTQAALDPAAGGSGCLALLVTGTSPAVSLRLADGETLTYSGEGAGELVISPARLAGFSDDRVLRTVVEPGRGYLMRPPDLAEPGTSWSLRLQPPTGTERWRLCVAPGR
jgi:hypothetical protein